MFLAPEGERRHCPVSARFGRRWVLALLVLGGSSEAQELQQTVDSRLRDLPKVVSQVAAAKECLSLLALINQTPSLSQKLRAHGLDQLRDACAAALQWTNPVLARIAEVAVARWRPLEAAEPAALCEALRQLGKSYHYLTRIEEARSLYLEAVRVARRWRGRGTKNETLAAALESLSGVQVDLLKFDEAMKEIGEAIRLRRSARPYLRDKVVSALGSRARIEMRIDRKLARNTLLEARKLSLLLGAKYSYERTRIASNLGEIQFLLGSLHEAVRLLQEAEVQRVSEGRLGRPVPQLAATQLLLGRVFVDLGDYPKAIDYFRKAVKGHLEWLGKDPYRYCDALSDLASVLEDSGAWKEALTMQREALLIREEAARDRADPELQRMLARSLTRFGALQDRMAVLSGRDSLERAQLIEDSKIPERASNDRAQTLLELARHWESAGDAPKARALAERSLKELALLAEEGPMLFEARELAARVAVKPDDGLRELSAAGSLALKLYGRNSSRLADLNYARAVLQQRRGDRRSALDDALASQRISLPQVTAIIQAFPRDQALAFAADRRKSLDLALRLLFEGDELPPETLAKVWQVAASSRMLVRDAEIDRQRLSLFTKDPHLARAAKRLAGARERYAYLLVQSQGRSDARPERLDEAHGQLAEAEEALAKKVRLTIGGGQVAPPAIEEFRHGLPSNAVLVAYFRYRALKADAYLAFVLTRSKPLHVVFLGSGPSIELLVERWRKSILSRRVSSSERSATGQELRQKIWDPIASQIGGPGPVFIVPDGALYLVSFAALPASKDSFLIEQGWGFHSLTVERDLLTGFAPNRTGPWLSVGGIDYDRGKQTVSAPSGPIVVSRGGDEERSDGCRGKEIGPFSPLPGSLKEIEDLSAIWRRFEVRPSRPSSALTTLLGQNATEQALRLSVRGKRIVHLATHGFVVASGCTPIASHIGGVGSLSLPLVESSDNSRTYSGLVLAGANDRQQAYESDQDGILTEDEILGLDLSAADWVVLSACGTGLGRIRPGEGIVGMLRAFEVVGARAVIVSLWSVEDQAARLWMRELYHARFGRRASTLEAMRQATLRRLLAYRQLGDDNPARWAGFVAIGHWN